MTTTQKALIVGGIILVITTLSIAYQAFVTIPRERLEAQAEKERTERQAEVLREMARERDYADCNQTAFNEYSMDWETACETLGRESNCGLPGYTADDLDETLEGKRDRCVQMYK